MNKPANKPLDETPPPMSKSKREWWSGTWGGLGSMKQPRVAVLHYVMNHTPRPSEPSESIAHGYTNMMKFHDREPETILGAIHGLDSSFFDSYPRRGKTKLNKTFKKSAIGEAALAFYRHGVASYGKPKLRKQTV